MRRIILLIFGMILLGPAARPDSLRYVVDDDGYAERVCGAGAKLLAQGKLLSLGAMQRQLRTKSAALKLTIPSVQKLEPPELYDRLRASTLAVGTLYKCPDCGGWHFSSSAGFVVGEDGVVCTCCHVVQEEEDKEIKESYLIAADAAGRVFPVRSVLAADTESDTCLLKLDARGLKPLALRPGVRTGERVYCLSHPGGYFFMFSQGMVARVNRRRNDLLDSHGEANSQLSRPILLLNVTAEFAPGSSGGPVVDESCNVVAQVASIADAGEPSAGDDHTPASPSVPIRFCTTAEEILRLTDPALNDLPALASPKLQKSHRPENRKHGAEAQHSEATTK